MTRTQIQFDPGDYERIKALAARHGISIAAAVRMLVRQALGEAEPASSERWEAFIRFTGGTDRERRSDVARRHDEYLYGAKAP